MVILYAENDFDDFVYFTEVVKVIDPTINCINVCDGIDALEFLERSQIPDFIFLDMNLPGMDGKTCLTIIRKVDALKYVPVIIYTTVADKREEEYCLQLGATAYVRKANSLEEAIETLTMVLKK